jgi:hypothetical protein
MVPPQNLRLRFIGAEACKADTGIRHPSALHSSTLPLHISTVANEALAYNHGVFPFPSLTLKALSSRFPVDIFILHMHMHI